MDYILSWDESIFVFLNRLGNKNFDSFWLFVTNQKNWIFLYVLVLLIYFFFLSWKKALYTILFLVAFLGICNETTDFFKAFFQRLRPSNDPALEGKIRELLHPHNYSFISGHASNSTLFVWFTVFVLRKYTRWIYVLIVWWILFMYSRIYVGVHYPLDIIFGIIWGLILFYIARFLYQKFLKY